MKQHHLVPFACLAFWLIAGFASAATPTRPNIVIIFADDMGYSDIGCYGGEVQTPNLDKLAAGGLRFSQFYNCALCGPSRSALMTGLHPHQIGISDWTGLLNDRCVTMFELMKRAGYSTYALGRLDMITADGWHDPANLARHVDRFFGSTGHKGPGHYFQPVRNTDFYLDGKPFKFPPEGSYKTDLVGKYGVEFIEDAARQQKPFLLYVSHYAPHWPLHAKPEDMAKYREMYRKLGWDEVRKQRYSRLIELGLISKDTALSPRDPRVAAWEDAKFKDWEAGRMAAYAAQIDSLDQSVGLLLDALKRTNSDQNTLILFLSDNGASDRPMNSNLDKPDQTWRLDGVPTQFGNDPKNEPGSPDAFLTAGPAWSNVANTPFRQHKSTNHEGGIATPLIAFWPGVIEKRGSITHDVGHITDLMATVLDVSGVSYPEEFNGRHVQPLAGKSLLPVFKEGTREGHPYVCWATTGCRAIRMGSWKLVAAKGGPWELYDMTADRTELHDLAAQKPERVAQMAAAFESWKKK